jgi:hypothetical protein
LGAQRQKKIQIFSKILEKSTPEQKISKGKPLVIFVKKKQFYGSASTINSMLDPRKGHISSPRAFI